MHSVYLCNPYLFSKIYLARRISKSNHIIFRKICFPPARLLVFSGRQFLGRSWKDLAIVAIEIVFLVHKRKEPCLLGCPSKLGWYKEGSSFSHHVGQEDTPQKRQAVTEELPHPPL